MAIRHAHPLFSAQLASRRSHLHIHDTQAKWKEIEICYAAITNELDNTMASAHRSPARVNLKALRTCYADCKELLHALQPHVVAWGKSVAQAFQCVGAEGGTAQTDLETFENRWAKLKRDEESVRVNMLAIETLPAKM